MLGKVNSYLRTSAYMDAIEQLRDEEVLSDRAVRTTTRARIQLDRKSSSDATNDDDTDLSKLKLLRAASKFGKLAKPAVRRGSSVVGEESPEPAVTRQKTQGQRFKHFHDADDERIADDHRLQSSLHGALCTFLRAPQRLIEGLFLVLLGVLSALLAMGINFAVDALKRCQSAAADVATSLGAAAARTPLLDLSPSTAVYTGDACGFVVYWLFSMAYATVALLACMPPPHGPGSRHAVGSGIPEIKAILSGYWLARYLSLRAFVAKVIGLIAALAAGFAIGKEGPLVHLCAALSTQLMKLPFFDAAIDENVHKKRAMLAAAAAVGVVATFGTPIGGVLFSVEVTATFYMVSNLWRGFVGAIACIIVFQGLTDLSWVSVPATDIPWAPHVGWEYLAFAGLGVMSGLLSGLIVKVMAIAVRLLRSHGLLRPVTRRLVTGLSVCTLAVVCKYALPLNSMEDGEHILTELFRAGPLHTRAGHERDWSLCPTGSEDEHWRDLAWYCHTTTALGTFCAFELMLMLLSIVLPIPNGCFMPLFILGSAFGRMYGVMLRFLLGYHRDALPDALLAVVGAAALTAGTTQTLSTALVAIELTGQQELLNPVLIGVVVSFGVTSLVSKSIYDQILVLKGLPYMPHLKTDNLYKMTANEIMRPTAAVLATASATPPAPAATSPPPVSTGRARPSKPVKVVADLDEMSVELQRFSPSSAASRAFFLDAAAGGTATRATACRATASSRLSQASQATTASPVRRSPTPRESQSFSELRRVELPTTNPYHPSAATPPGRGGGGGALEGPLMPLACTMSVGDVLRLCRMCRDRVLPLVESAHTPTLLGALMRAQLLEWFEIEVELAEMREEEEEEEEEEAGVGEVGGEGGDDEDALDADGVGAPAAPRGLDESFEHAADVPNGVVAADRTHTTAAGSASGGAPSHVGMALHALAQKAGGSPEVLVSPRCRSAVATAAAVADDDAGPSGALMSCGVHSKGPSLSTAKADSSSRCVRFIDDGDSSGPFGEASSTLDASTGSISSASSGFVDLVTMSMPSPPPPPPAALEKEKAAEQAAEVAEDSVGSELSVASQLTSMSDVPSTLDAQIGSSRSLLDAEAPEVAAAAPGASLSSSAPPMLRETYTPSMASVLEESPADDANPAAVSSTGSHEGHRSMGRPRARSLAARVEHSAGDDAAFPRRHSHEERELHAPASAEPAHRRSLWTEAGLRAARHSSSNSFGTTPRADLLTHHLLHKALREHRHPTRRRSLGSGRIKMVDDATAFKISETGLDGGADLYHAGLSFSKAHLPAAPSPPRAVSPVPKGRAPDGVDGLVAKSALSVALPHETVQAAPPAGLPSAVSEHMSEAELAPPDLLDDVERYLGDLERPFPWDEIEWNRCALQLSTQTGLDEIHNLFAFMSIGQVWITSGGLLHGVVTDRALIAACLHGEEQHQHAEDEA